MATMSIAYQIITDRITKLLEDGVCAWTKPWNSQAGLPRNLFSQRAYRGINVWMLGAQSYSSPFWATFNQVKQAGGNVKKGEKSTPIVFWKKYEGTNGDGEIESRFVLKYYNVFCAPQLEGVAIPALPEETVFDHTPLEQCEKVVTNYPLRPAIMHGSSQAFYRPRTDEVHMPDLARFPKREAYYATLFHELTHSTGHTDRLSRESLVDAVAFGTPRYAREELVAEMGAAYLCGHCGIENDVIDNSAAYLKGWLECLRGDVKLLVTAAGQAQKAVDHILGPELVTREPGQDDA